MKLALMQAQRNLGNTKENPAVGCVIVKNDCIISVGYTGASGTPHAEQNAIVYSKNNISNSNLYVTLEPCAMCAGAIIKSRLKNIYFGAYNKSDGCVSSLYNLCLF